MWISKRVLLALTLAIFAAFSLALAVGAFGDRGRSHAPSADRGGRAEGRALLKSALAPSQPTDPTFHGVQAGAAPWVIRHGQVRVRGHRLELRVRGLVIPRPEGDGTPGQVTTVSASLYCGADTETAPADTTDQVPISRRGNARIRDRSFDVPDTCLAPIVLVHPNGNTTRYIAVDGWRR